MNEHTDLAKDFCQCRKKNKIKIDMFYIAMGIKPKQVLLLLLKAPRRYSGDSGGGFSTAFSFLCFIKSFSLGDLLTR